MRIKWFIATLLLTGLILPACTAAPKEFRSTEGRFSVVAPISFKEETQTLDTTVGKIEMHMFIAEGKDIAYAVAYSDYPEEMIRQSNPDQVLNGARDGMVSNVNGKLVLETKITLGKYPGREVVVDLKLDNDIDGTVKSRMYLVENRMYQTQVITTKGAVSMQTISDFLDSFQLIGE